VAIGGAVAGAFSVVVFAVCCADVPALKSAIAATATASLFMRFPRDPGNVVRRNRLNKYKARHDAKMHFVVRDCLGV